MKNTCLIFLHGAGLNKGIWSQTTESLNMPNFCPDYPNRVPSKNENKGLMFSDYVQACMDQLTGIEKYTNVIIIGHSVGGCVGLALAERIGAKLKGFIGISAAIPVNGGSYVSCLPFPQRFILPLLIKVAGTKPPDKAIIAGLCSGLSQEKTQEILDNFTPESGALFTGKVQGKIPDCKKAYIQCIADNEFSSAFQQKMIQNLQPDHIYNIESGHLPMISHPQRIKESIEDFCVSNGLF